MSSLKRALAVLDLFTGERPAWTAEEIALHLDYSLPTVYRYARELSEMGLLRGESGAHFVLGPKIIELDYQLRIGDPLLNAARESMHRLAEGTGFDVVLVTVCGGHIVTVHQEFGTEGINASYGRGRRMPLFRGAMSKCLLAALPRPQLRKLYNQYAQQGWNAGDLPSWDTLLEQAKRIRHEGYAVTMGELDQDNVGLAVPLANSGHKVVAALGFIMSQRRFALIEIKRAVALLEGCVRDIQRHLSESAKQVSLMSVMEFSEAESVTE